MNTPNTGESAQHLATAAYHQAFTDAQAQLDKVAYRFDLFLSGRDNITPLDCRMVMYSAETLIATLQTLKQAVKDRAGVQGGAQ